MAEPAQRPRGSPYESAVSIISQHSPKPGAVVFGLDDTIWPIFIRLSPQQHTAAELVLITSLYIRVCGFTVEINQINSNFFALSDNLKQNQSLH